MMRYLCAALIAMTGLAVPDSALAQGFRPCDDADDFAALAGSQCAVSRVPLQPGAAASQGETISLFVRKFPATGSRRPNGQIWLVSGGPGESGASLYPVLPALRRAYAGYDLMIPDHRGTGYSGKLCPVQESPTSPDGIALAGEEWGACIGEMHSNAERTASFTITNAARDLATLIGQHRRRGKVHVYGVSYGTQLVLRMMQVAPPKLDGIILDGLVPPESSNRWDLSRRTQVVDSVGRQLLGPKRSDQYAMMLAKPQPDWLASVPGGDLRRLMGSFLTFPAIRDRIPDIIDALSRNDNAPLIAAIADIAVQAEQLALYPQSPPSLPLVMLISASENNARPDLTADTVAAEARDALFTSALPGLLVNSPAPPYRRDAFHGKVPHMMPRTLVIHGTLDPNTPYAGALAQIELLAPSSEIHLVTVESGAHFLALTAPECFARSAAAFVSGAPVADRCREPDR